MTSVYATTNTELCHVVDHMTEHTADLILFPPHSLAQHNFVSIFLQPLKPNITTCKNEKADLKILQNYFVNMSSLFNLSTSQQEKKTGNTREGSFLRFRGRTGA